MPPPACLRVVTPGSLSGLGHGAGGLEGPQKSTATAAARRAESKLGPNLGEAGPPALTPTQQLLQCLPWGPGGHAWDMEPGHQAPPWRSEARDLHPSVHLPGH